MEPPLMEKGFDIADRDGGGGSAGGTLTRLIAPVFEAANQRAPFSSVFSELFQGRIFIGYSTITGRKEKGGKDSSTDTVAVAASCS